MTQMFNAVPLMIIPFILYNMSMLGLMGGGGLPRCKTTSSFCR